MCALAAACRGLIDALIADPTRTVPIPGPPGVAAHSRCGAALWRELHRWGKTPVVTDPERCPPEPWVAVALDAGITQHMDATEWLGDFERCLAWAFRLSRDEAAHHD
ncbi:MAG: hypothetical protein M3436_01505 [Pseudomonadota bacterium]|nr:hypothetical protein [Pseudomonadota bacterium]